MLTAIGIDIGTSKTVIIRGKNIVLNEHTAILMDTYDDVPVAFGNDAYKAIGRNSEKYEVICPIERGVITNYNAAEYIFENFISKTTENKITRPRVIAAIPCCSTSVERRSIIEALQIAGCRSVVTIETPVAAALGMGIDFSGPGGYTVIDIGAGTTDIAVLSLGRLAKCESIKLAGVDIDQAIINYVKSKYNIIIGIHTAQMVKHNIGSVIERPFEVGMMIKGINAISLMPDSVEVTDRELFDVIYESVENIFSNISNILMETAPELVGDIKNNGIYLTGGSSLLYGMKEKLSEYLGVNIITFDNVETCVSRGLGKILRNKEFLKAGNYNSVKDILLEDVSIP